MRAEPNNARLIISGIRKKVFEFESRFSRFNPNSELSRLNRAMGKPYAVSEDMLEVLSAAKKIGKVTAGLIDITIGQILINTGYDASFEKIKNRQYAAPSDTPEKNTYADIVIDQANQTVTLPPKTSLDFGGLGKGYLLDKLSADIFRVTENFWVSLGGDMVISGKNEQGLPWEVGVQNPKLPANDIGKLCLAEGCWGIATSGVIKRRGLKNGTSWHHIIDPRIQRPAESDVLSATVVASSALLADAYAKVIVILGMNGGISWAEKQPDIEALAIDRAGHIRFTPDISNNFNAL